MILSYIYLYLVIGSIWSALTQLTVDDKFNHWKDALISIVLWPLEMLLTLGLFTYAGKETLTDWWYNR